MFLKSLCYALSGIFSAVKSERNLRIMLICLLIVISVSFIIGLSTVEWAIILLCCSLAVSLEIVNSSIEAAIDSITDSYSSSAKKAKDAAAGAVLFFSVFIVIIGLIIFIPHIISIFTNIG